MKRYEAIIQSETAPSTSSLWLKNKKLWFFEGEWNAIESTSSNAGENEACAKIEKFLLGEEIYNMQEPSIYDKILELYYELLNTQGGFWGEKPFGDGEYQGLLMSLFGYIGTNYMFPSLWDKFTFYEGTFEDYRGYNIDTLKFITKKYSMNTNVPVYIEDFNSKVPALYKNAHLYTIIDGKFKVYNINTNQGTRDEGAVTEIKSVDLTLLPTYIDLELGNTDEIKSYNLEQLQKVTGTQFFVHADYGIGVGSFNSGYGGETTIQTAGGDRVHYLITADGECKKQEDRFEHSELFFNLGQIDVATLPKTITISNSVDMAKFKKATSLAFEASNSGAFIDDVSMNQVSVNALTNQRIYTSPDLICVEDQDWNYIRALATTYDNRVEIYLETL